MRSWFNWLIAGLLAATIADLIFGLDRVLNAISVIVALAAGVAVVSAALAGALALSWIVIRDAVDEIRTDRGSGRAWRWRIAGWIGIAGVVADGVAGAWNAYQEHVLFSTAVEEIPFAGVPVVLALGSYPFRWIENYLMKRRREARKAREALSAG